VGVLILLLFVFILFGITGLQLFSGPQLHTRCRLTPYPVFTNWTLDKSYESHRCLHVPNFDLVEEESWSKTESPWSTPQDCYWPVDDTQLSFCSLNDGGMYQCIHDTSAIPKSNWTWCGSNYDAKGNPRFKDHSLMNEPTFIVELNWGYANYDNIFEALLTVFQVITLEGWTDLMYFAQDSVNQYYSALLYVALILFGAFFCLNLLLAVLEDNFQHTTTDPSSTGTWKSFVLGLMRACSFGEEETYPTTSPSSPSSWYQLVRQHCRKISRSSWFDSVITFFIIINTLVLALDYYPQDQTFSNFLDLFNFIFSFIFLFEMIIKILSYNIFIYISDMMNLLDGIIVITSFIELITSPPLLLGGHDGNTSGSISALRSFRLFRIFKLISKWESMRLIILKVFKTVKDLANFALLLFLILFIYTLIGMQFFANRFHFDSTGHPITHIGSHEWATAPFISRSNFDDFTHAFATVFQILTTENWNSVMYDCRKVAGLGGVIYPCSLIIIGDYIFMNLFLAILIGNFSNNEIIDELVSDYSSSDDSLDLNPSHPSHLSHGGDSGSGIGGDEMSQSDEVTNQHKKRSISHPNPRHHRASTVFPISVPQLTVEPDSHSTEPQAQQQQLPLQSIPSNDSGVSSQTPAGHHQPHQPLPETDRHSISDDSDTDDSTSSDLEFGPVSSPATETIFPLYPSHTLYLFGPEHPIRQFCAHLISNKKFDQIVLILIVISSISLVLDNPLDNPHAIEAKILSWFDLILTLLFSFEMIIKIIALGFLFGESAYLHSPWNVLDFIVVIISFLSTFSENGTNLSSFRSLRALRALRPLRVINRAPGLKLVVNAMLASIPDVMNVLALCFLFFLIFSIFCVNYFQGMLRSCDGDVFHSSIKLHSQYYHLLTYPKYWSELNDEEKGWFGPESNVTTLDCTHYSFPLEPCCSSYPSSHHQEQQQQITSRMICECWGGTWQYYTHYQFDNVLEALLSLFQMSTTEGWVTLMYTLTDTTGIDMQPILNSQIQWIYFSIFFMLIGSYLALNIFVGVVIDNFNKMKALVDGNLAFLTIEQQEWIHTQEIIKRLRPIKKLSRPIHAPLTALVYDICYHPWFEWFIMYTILFNTIIMAMVYFGQHDLYGSFLNKMNLLFALIFTSETILKLIIFKFHYFEDHWNKFDFFVVIGTNIGLLYLFFSGSKIGLAITILRTFRITRVIRLMNGTEKINQLLNTLVLTLPGLGNIAALLFLLFFIYGVMGVQLFAKIAYHGSYNSNCNFRDFGTALLSLLRFSTGEAWNDFMYDASQHTTHCVPNPSYDPDYCGFSNHIGCLPLNGCGSFSIFPYMISFTIIITVVFINLFVGVILEGFSSADTSDKTIKSEDFLKYCDHWALYDPHATCYLTLEELESFINTLFEPLGFGNRDDVTRKEIMDRIGAMNLHVFRGKKVHFRDVLSGLSTEAIKRVSLSLSLSLTD
jgi:voltage-dependent calcium channel L type alpha-1D